jgi:hypothetical protein
MSSWEGWLVKDDEKLTIEKVLVLFVTIVWVCPPIVSLYAETAGVSRYNVVWTSPSKDAAGSMPLGNGDIGLNVWMDQTGDLCFYIGKTDAWGDNARLLKVGRVRISIAPNPLGKDIDYRQILNLDTGEIVFEFGPRGSEVGESGRSTLRIWVDANDPVVYVTCESAKELSLTARIELWRTERYELPSLEVSDVHLDRSKAGQKHAPTIVEPDTILKDLDDRIGWLHHNKKSVGPELTMRVQGLADYPMDDPLLGRTFGAVITASNGQRSDDMTLSTKPGTSHQMAVFVLTDHPSTPEKWLTKINNIIARVESVDLQQRRECHVKWWRDFWDRSWMHIRSNSAELPPIMVGQNDHSVRIGSDQGGGNRFVGEIGRVSVLQTVLSAEQVAQLSQRNREALTQPGVIGSWVDVPIGHELGAIEHSDLAGALSIEAWVRPGDLPAGGGRIFDKITPGKDDGVLLDTWPGDSLRLITVAGHLEQRDCLAKGTWHHVAATIDPHAGIQRLFLDGRVVGQQRIDRTEPALVVSRGYQLQRFINACAGRGRYPIKFNGSIFTVPYPGGPGDADYRRWGPGYWWQNTRLPYISMCTSGDFDLMRPLFRMYVDEILPLSVHRTKKYCGHGGAFFPECIYFWGAIFSETYGWTPFEQRTDKLQESGWHKWEWVCGPELIFMMLDYYEHTQDEIFLREKILPTAHEVLSFFDRHYSVGPDGRLVMHPAQALETWWNCTNPMPEPAGLRAVTSRLLQLPKKYSTERQRTFWQSLKNKLPELPTREVDGAQMLAPAEKFENKRNIENPELYAVFPFRLVSFEKDSRLLGIEALKHRWDRGRSGWRQDDIFMAYLGLAEQAKENVIARARSYDRNSRFPAFWGPNYDWVPDQDHGGVLVRAVQAMLLQTEGKKIFLLPAWPREWDVDFRLHAPYQTVVQGRFENGRFTRLSVIPAHRKDDVIMIEVATAKGGLSK